MNRKSVASLAAVASIAAMLCGAPAASAVPEPVDDLGPGTLLAGQGCAFGLRYEGIGAKAKINKFVDEKGNVVRSITAGKGYALTFTNTDTSASITFQSNGSVNRTTYDAAGTSTTVVTGHNVLILFPTDDPAGPSTTLYVGRVVYTVDASGNWKLQSTSGRSVDICAALS